MLRPNSRPRPARLGSEGNVPPEPWPGVGKGHWARSGGADKCPLAPPSPSLEEKPGSQWSTHSVFLWLAPLSRTPQGWHLRFLPPGIRGAPPRDAWLGPGRGWQALHVRPRSLSSAPAALEPPPPARGGASGGGAEAWEGGGADAERSPGCPGRGAERSGAGGGIDRKGLRADVRPTPGAPDLTLRYEQEPGAWGAPLPRPQPAHCALPPALPPAGRAATGRGFGRVWKVASPGESSDSSASFFAFSLLRRLWASGTGRVCRLSRVGARLRRGGRTGPGGSRAGLRGRHRSSRAACAARAGGRPGLRAAPWGSVRGVRVPGGPWCPILRAPVRRVPSL